MFSTNPYYIILQRFECYTALIAMELLYNKNQMFYFYFKKCRNLQTLTNISNNTIKQYYGITKTFEVLVIIKKKQFTRTNILI